MSSRTRDREYRYRAAWWLRNAHAQTIWGRFARRRPRVPTGVEHLTSPDGDNLELHHLDAAPGAPRVLLLHGLEGSSESHYVGGILSEARARGWGASLLVFRGCGSEANVARRFYHSGETDDVAFVFARLAARWPDSEWLAVGVSLGGNVLLKWLGEPGNTIASRIRAAAAVSVPFDLEAGARHIARGVARIYDRSFLRSLRRKALAKLSRYPNLFDREQLERARNVYDFDDAVTAPVHGFAGAHDYYEKSSSLQYLPGIRVPTLLLSSSDDPFLPRAVLARAERVAKTNPALTVEFHDSGGHVGFVAGWRPWRPWYYAEWRAFRYFEEVMERGAKKRYD
jgi:predicted alpha/beta-fold hydrolase